MSNVCFWDFLEAFLTKKKFSDIKVTIKSLMYKILLQLFGADQLEIEEIERYVSRYVLIAEGKEV